MRGCIRIPSSLRAERCCPATAHLLKVVCSLRSVVKWLHASPVLSLECQGVSVMFPSFLEGTVLLSPATIAVRQPSYLHSACSRRPLGFAPRLATGFVLLASEHGCACMPTSIPLGDESAMNFEGAGVTIQTFVPYSTYEFDGTSPMTLIIDTTPVSATSGANKVCFPSYAPLPEVRVTT